MDASALCPGMLVRVIGFRGRQTVLRVTSVSATHVYLTPPTNPDQAPAGWPLRDVVAIVGEADE